MDYQDLDNTSPEPQTTSTFESNSTYPDFSNYRISQKISFAFGLIKEFFFPLVTVYLVYYITSVSTMLALLMSNTIGFNGIILRLLDNDRRKPQVSEIFIPLNDNRVIRLLLTLLLFSFIIASIVIISILASILIFSITSDSLTSSTLGGFIGILLLAIIFFAVLFVLAIANIVYSIMSFYLVEFEAGPWEAIKNSFAIFKASWKHWLKALITVAVGSIPIIIICSALSFAVSFAVVLLGGSTNIYEGGGLHYSFFITFFIQFALIIIEGALITLYSSIIYGMAYREIMKPESITEHMPE